MFCECGCHYTQIHCKACCFTKPLIPHRRNIQRFYTWSDYDPKDCDYDCYTSYHYNRRVSQYHNPVNHITQHMSDAAKWSEALNAVWNHNV